MLQTISIAGSRIINAAATFFKYESGSANGANEAVEVRADGQDLGDFYPGDSVQLPTLCSTWEINPISPDCKGTVRLGVGLVQSTRLVGNVRIIDTAADKTKAGNQFIGSTAAGIQAGQCAYLNLFAVSRDIVVKSVSLQSSIAGDMWIAHSIGGGTAVPDGGLGPRNKLLGEPESSSKYSGGYGASAIPTALEIPNYVGVTRVSVPANVVTQIPMTTPLILRVGRRLVVNANALARDVSAVFDIEE